MSAFQLLAAVPGGVLEPLPWLGFVLQIMGLGGAVGTAYAYLRTRHKPDADRWVMVSGGALFGLLGGILIVLVDALLS